MSGNVMRNEFFDNKIIEELKSLLSSKNNVKISNAVKFIQYTLTSHKPDKDKYIITCDIFIKSDLPYFLCEALATTDFTIIKSILQCWHYLSDSESFYTQNCVFSVLRVTSLSISFILKKQCESELDLSLEVLNKIFVGLVKFNCNVQRNAAEIEYVLQILQGLFESNNGVNHVSLWCCKIFESVLPLIMWNEKANMLRKLYILFHDAIRTLKNAYEKYSHNFDWIDKINTICSSIMQALSNINSKKYDTFFESAEDRESTSTINQIIEICYDTFIDICTLRYLSSECDLDPLPHSKPFLKVITEFFNNKYAETYRVDLANRLNSMGIFRRIKTIIYLEPANTGSRILCLECAAEILTSLAQDDLQELSSKGLTSFQADIMEGLLELPEDPSCWFQIFTDNCFSQLAVTALLIYEYFELRTLSDRRYAVQHTFPYLVVFINSLKELTEIPRIIIKCLWFIFACSYLSASTREHIEGTTAANNWLLAAIMKNDIRNLYTNDFSLLLWAFANPLSPKHLLSELFILTISKNNDSDTHLKHLVENLSMARLILIDLICSKENDIIDVCSNILLTSSPDQEQLEDCSIVIWNYLSKFLPDDNSQKKIMILLRLCINWPVAKVSTQNIQKVLYELVEIWNGCFDPQTTRKILFDKDFRNQSLLLMDIILCEMDSRNDQKALKKVISKPRFLTAIDMNTMCKDTNVATACWEILNTITRLQKSPETVTLPLHPGRLLSLWSGPENAASTKCSLRLIESILDSECPATIVTLKWSKNPKTDIMYAQSIAATLQFLCTSGYHDAWYCLSAFYKYATHNEVILEPLAKFNYTHYLIRSEIKKGIIVLEPIFLMFLKTWFQLIDKLDEKTQFIAERATNPLRKFSNCHFSHLLEETLTTISKILIHDQTSHLDKEVRNLIADIENSILRHKDILYEELIVRLEKHCSIIDI